MKTTKIQTEGLKPLSAREERMKYALRHAEAFIDRVGQGGRVLELVREALAEVNKVPVRNRAAFQCLCGQPYALCTCEQPQDEWRMRP